MALSRTLLLARAVTLLALTATLEGRAQQPGSVGETPATPPAAVNARGVLGESVPDLPPIRDPLLRPVPPAPRVLVTWKQALQLIRTRNASLRIAAAQIELAASQARQAVTASRPSLLGSGTVQRHLLTGQQTLLAPTGPRTATIPDPPTIWSAGVDLQVPLFAPRAWYDAQTAQERTRAVELEGRDMQRVVLAAAAESIVSVVTAERLAEVSRSSLSYALVNVDLNRRRAALGAATGIDVLRAEQEAAAARAQVVLTEEAVLKAREALGLALGFAEPWGVAPSIDLDALVADAMSICSPQRGVKSRADVLAAGAQVDTARREVDGYERDFLPTLNGVSALTYSGNEALTANQEHVTWTIGALLQWSLYDGGLRYARRAINQHQLTLAQEQHTDLLRRAEVEATQAKRGIELAEASLRVGRQARDLAQRSAALARTAFATGTGTSFDLVDSAARLREAELDLTIKEFDLVRAKISALMAIAQCRL